MGSDDNGPGYKPGPPFVHEAQAGRTVGTVGLVRLLGPDATVLIDADFSIEVSGEDPRRFSLTVESSGGGAGAGNVRNPEYPLLLEEALGRLSHLDVELADAHVDSRRVAHLPEAERRIAVDGRPFPIRLADVTDFVDLRRGLTRPQRDIGSTRTAGGGNQRKRVRLEFRAQVPLTLSELMEVLRVVDSGSSLGKAGVAGGLSRSHLDAAITEWRRIGGDAFAHRFGTRTPARFVVVDGEDEIDAVALILWARTIAGFQTEGPWREDRANVTDPLRRLGLGVDDLARPTEGPLGPDTDNYVGLARRLGGTDMAVRRMGRREQRYLRGALGIATGDPDAVWSCGMCARSFPESFLIAAHIKPRHACSHTERLDMPHVGWALCVAGCDALFEQGYVGVDEAGLIVGLRPPAEVPEALLELMAPLLGRRAPGWSSSRSIYFEAHRSLHRP